MTNPTPFPFDDVDPEKLAASYEQMLDYQLAQQAANILLAARAWAEYQAMLQRHQSQWN